MVKVDVAGEGKNRESVAVARPPQQLFSGGLDALVLDGETRQSLTATRVLGRAGLRVGVAGERRDEAPAMHSRWCKLPVLLPSLIASPDAYAKSLLTFLDERPTSVVIPSYDGSIEAVRQYRDQIEQRTALALATEDALEIAVDKDKSLALADYLGIRIPRSTRVTNEIDLERALTEIGLPAVLKPVRSWSTSDGVGVRLGSLPIDTVDEARAGFHLISSQGGEAILQQWLPGRRDAVTLFVDQSDVKACFAQTSHRELPRLGGVSVLCESIPPLDDIVLPARRLVSAMGLQGCSIVEFRRDSGGRPVLMEVNPRLPGSVALAVSCGVDFPRLMYDWALGHPIQKVPSYRTGRRLRWMTGDLWSLYSALHRDHGPDVPSPLAAWWEFLKDSVKRDLPATFDAADPLPALIEVRAHLFRPVWQRVRTSRDRHETDRGSMTTENTDVAIIGAGPYGLSLATHLRAREVPFRIFGTPMRFWLDMAPGISLKSFDFATNIYPPQRGFDFVTYCKERGITSHEPCAMEKFAEYGLWAQQQLVPEVEDVQVTSLRTNGDGFLLTLDDGREISARRAAVAVGLVNFPRVPEELQIDSPRVSHTSQIRDYERFRGMDVIVIGGGQSALEAGGLLNQHGATARMLIRGNGTWFADKMSPNRSLKERWKFPMTVMGPGQLNWVLEHFKWLPYELPDDKRIRLVRKHLGPFGTWWVRDQMDDKVPMINNTKVIGAEDRGHEIALRVSGPDGEEDLVADHVIAGTGYEVDVDRIPFLDAGLKSSIDRIEKAPRLSRSFESSVPGLYFMGPSAMFSFGPLLRFACGAEYAAPKVARHMSSRKRVE